MSNKKHPEESGERSETTDLHRYVRRSGWPLDDYFPEPSLVDLKDEKNSKEQISVYLTKQVNRSLERHIQTMGTSKQKWIEYAILLLLEKEQKSFSHRNKSK